jgi:hypothetical protein
MILANIRDWLKTLDVAEHYYTNRLDNKQEKSLGVYNRTAAGRPVTALGGIENSSYNILPVSLLLHWNRSYPQAEAAAQDLWDKLQGVTDIDIPGDQHIQFLQMTVLGPVYVSTDQDGIHEFVISFNLYYRR